LQTSVVSKFRFRELFLKIAQGHPWDKIEGYDFSDTNFSAIFLDRLVGNIIISVVLFNSGIKTASEYRLDISLDNTPVLAFDLYTGIEMKGFWKEDWMVNSSYQFKYHQAGQFIEQTVKDWLLPNSIKLILELEHEH